jgi:hypothetical protein
MQIINLLNKSEAKQFLAGHMIQTVGTNPLIAFEGGRARSTPAQAGVIDVTPRGNSPKHGNFPCGLCSKVCTTKQALGGHVASHNRRKGRKLLTHAGSKHS